MKLNIFFTLLIGSLLLSCNGQPSGKVKSMPPALFEEKINTTQYPQLLDVRTPEEYAGQHLDNAVNLSWNDSDFAEKASKYDKTKPVFVYCLSGGRSQRAALKLSEMGFKEVYDLEGGMMKWNAAGLSKPGDKIIGMCSQEYNDLLKSDKKVLISFYADWCEPCKKMAPFITQMQKDLAGKITIIRLNADENKTMVSELKIDELPSLLLYENKEVKWKHSGYISEEDLKKQL